MDDMIERAALFSRAAHQAVGQRRKYTGESYWHHPVAVAERVSAVETATVEMIAAAHLHDVLEDTAVTALDIEACFGERVAVLVLELTDQFVDPEIGNRAHRKALERDRLAQVSPEAQTIKYADLIDNTYSIVARARGFARVYLAEKRRLLEVMTAGDPALRRQAWRVLVEGEAKIRGVAR
ncbi:bifunctional (p)ppGpp synthetase/guanosine-3',5'-bis(diphosphate) 3'-pyrophosphohydrolase [Billgrantia pellis]|uniref:Bifunctional (P)ppGpp synthetase/guanosine-3',5'-bis(Diphosphate) 3'-pyrophosphohydrolase n=1 Tax=Billgrantia pellis TaxID=2606936 RepID=A0A7V7KHP4_9GAMM|nr:HD domain-containing protein [Halomonas pellis]KAA0012014.1 bifunctional (p)ppGpp synthetase/guanosine-3',5'-bis(diphosphate) 3'-pyrophosphohydrolase [Halomonas pellis]